YKTGRLASVTDTNGQTELFTFDEFGRPDAIYGPKDVVPGTLTPNGIPTIKFEYKPFIDTAFTQATPPPVTVTPSQATTHHKDTSRASAATTTDTIDTVTYIDGFERVIQTAKEDEVTDG